MDPRSSTLGGNRRSRPIPRPWLSEHHHVRPLDLYPDYRYAPPSMMGGASYNPNTPDSMDILQKHDRSISWRKLSCCFCLRGEPQSPSQKNNTERKQSYNDHVPFPAFPILRRNSSSSLLMNENDVSLSSGSYSSFTESDTSNSESEIDVSIQRNHTFDAGELRLPSPPRPSTPPPVPVTSKPHTIANRSRSAGLPPMKMNPNSNSSWATPQPPVRARMGSDFTGMHSGTTNTSRHRRLHQYEFSQRSMNDIWQGKPVDEKLVLPSYVLCQAANTSAPNDSGYISALEDSEDWGTHHNDSYYDGDNDDDFMDDLESNSRPSQLGLGLQPQKMASADRRRRNDERPPKASSAARRTRSRRNNKEVKNAQLPPPKKPSSNVGPPVVPVYLRKNPTLDNTTEGNLVVSGWVAFSLGSLLEKRLRYDSKRVESKNILYLQIVDDEASGARMLLNSSNGTLVHELHLQRDWMCESREISSRIGRYVNIRSRQNPMSSIANLLPVSLDDAFFQGDDEEFVSPRQFGQLHDRLFVTGKGKLYAPDDQHDAAMYIMFSLDALIKNCL